MRQAVLTTKAVAVSQPLGTFFITSISSDILSSIAFADVRRLETGTTAVEQYLGIQRKLDPKRRKEIATYVRTVDATFPTSVVIGVEDERCVEFSADNQTLTFYEISDMDDSGPPVPRAEIGRILDGQHRLAGLRDAGTSFDLSVTVFSGIEVADQAYIFATVNIAQTKVNASLAYDLLAYARSRSPERTCHDVAVALNSAKGSPFDDKIKRLGSATPGVTGETLAQATFVRALLPYISRDPMRDREDLRRGHSLPLLKNPEEIRLTPLRNLFINEQDDVITNIIWNYFDSVRIRWPDAWNNEARGQIIKRTNGFRAFMNVFGNAFWSLGGSDRAPPKANDFLKIWGCSTAQDSDFVATIYVPGTSGERNLTKTLQSAIDVFRTRAPKNMTAG